MKGKMNIMKQKLYHFDTSFYAIEISETFDDQTEASKAMYKYYAKLRRIQQNPKYCGISYGIGISNQDGQTATKIEIKNGKRGRPLTCVTSKKTKNWHIHCVVYGNRASSFCQEFIEYYRKGNSLDIRKHCLATADRKGADYVPYCYNQCIKWLTHGKFDFSILYNNLVWKEYTEYTQADGYIFSHKESASKPEKTPATLDFSAFRTLYVIIATLISFMHLHHQNTSTRNTENISGRTLSDWVRSVCHAQKRPRLVHLCIDSIPLRQNEDYRLHTAKPWSSTHFLNDHFLQRVHHTSVVTPCRYVLSL